MPTLSIWNAHGGGDSREPKARTGRCAGWRSGGALIEIRSSGQRRRPKHNEVLRAARLCPRRWSIRVGTARTWLCVNARPRTAPCPPYDAACGRSRVAAKTGGARGFEPDLLIANEALSQIELRPIKFATAKRCPLRGSSARRPFRAGISLDCQGAVFSIEPATRILRLARACSRRRRGYICAPASIHETAPCARFYLHDWRFSFTSGSDRGCGCCRVSSPSTW